MYTNIKLVENAHVLRGEPKDDDRSGRKEKELELVEGGGRVGRGGRDEAHGARGAQLEVLRELEPEGELVPGEGTDERRVGGAHLHTGRPRALYGQRLERHLLDLS